jgi:hypothetical protein
LIWLNQNHPHKIHKIHPSDTKRITQNITTPKQNRTKITTTSHRFLGRTTQKSIHRNHAPYAARRRSRPCLVKTVSWEPAHWLPQHRGRLRGPSLPCAGCRELQAGRVPGLHWPLRSRRGPPGRPPCPAQFERERERKIRRRREMGRVGSK